MHYAAVANQLGDFHGGHVQGIGQRVAHRDFSHEFFAEIVGRVFRAVVFERGRFVINGCRRRDDRLYTVDGVIEGCCINEGFKNGTRLTMCERVIELALSVVAASDDRLDFSRARIERHERHLRLRDRLVASLLGQFAAPFVVSLGEKQVHILHPRVHCGGGGALERRIQSRIHAEILAEQLRLRILVQQVVFHHVHEVGRFAASDGTTDNLQWRTLGILHIFCGNKFIIEHLRQDAIARLHSAFGMPVRRGIIIWRADQAGEERALGKRKLPQIFPEIRDAGLGKTANPEAAAIAEINFVGIQLENLLLGKTLLELERNHGFRGLAAHGALIG